MKIFIIKLIKYLFVTPGIFIEALSKRNSCITLLMYHRVNDDINKEISVKEKNFIYQLSYLKKKGFSVISLDEACQRIKTGNIDKRYIVLTFDDGYDDYYHNAYPLLKRFEYPSIVYIVPGFIETGKVFWWDKCIGKSSLMSWKQIEELSLGGLVDFGSHTMYHRDLNTLEDSEVYEELAASKKEIEAKLGKAVKHFAYPRGIYSKAADRIGKDFYETGALIFDGTPINNVSFKDFMKIKRIPVQRSDGKYLFIARLRGWLVLEEVIKKLMLKY